ncbi:MAG: hypothetical protein LAP21_18775 [Acidobacteriia bacterium]|nr:hypothetical protein [Terriglobia bacterium]
MGSEQEEKAAKWEMVENLRKFNKRLAEVRIQMKDLGELLIRFAMVLKEPDSYVFDVTDKDISVGKYQMPITNPVVEIGAADLKWEEMACLVEEYQEIANNIRTWKAQLNLPK